MMRDKIEKVVQDIAYYVGQGLTSKESKQYTDRIMEIIRRNNCG
jgi:hypothetical protein